MLYYVLNINSQAFKYISSLLNRKSWNLDCSKMQNIKMKQEIIKIRVYSKKLNTSFMKKKHSWHSEPNQSFHEIEILEELIVYACILNPNLKAAFFYLELGAYGIQAIHKLIISEEGFSILKKSNWGSTKTIRKMLAS